MLRMLRMVHSPAKRLTRPRIPILRKLKARRLSPTIPVHIPIRMRGRRGRRIHRLRNRTRHHITVVRRAIQIRRWWRRRRRRRIRTSKPVKRTTATQVLFVGLLVVVVPLLRWYGRRRWRMLVSQMRNDSGWRRRRRRFQSAVAYREGSVRPLHARAFPPSLPRRSRSSRRTIIRRHRRGRPIGFGEWDVGGGRGGGGGRRLLGLSGGGEYTLWDDEVPEVGDRVDGVEVAFC